MLVHHRHRSNTSFERRDCGFYQGRACWCRPDSTVRVNSDCRRRRHSSNRPPMDRQCRSHGSLCRGTSLYVFLNPSPNLDRRLTQSYSRADGPVLQSRLAKIVGACIKLNPLLAPPSDTHDYLRWNMLFHASNCYRTTEPQQSWVKGRNAPAPFPRLTHICIISRAFPWMIHTRAEQPRARRHVQ